MKARQATLHPHLLRGLGRLLLISWVLPMGGCRLIGGGSPSPVETPPPTGVQAGVNRGVVYHGTLTLDGGQISAGLEIRRGGGGDVWGALETVSGLQAEGTGRLRGENLAITLSYGGDCPGEISLDGPWDREVGVFEGSVEASDCTGAASGTFRLVAG